MLSRMYLGAVSTTIGGGTSEIQRNIVAMRGIGLPRQ
jgi:alkylation response protein AidB-like acyl-CoA dehydrogenase